MGAGRFVAVANRSAGNGGDDNGLRIQRFTRDGELLGGAITIPERYYLYPGQYGVAADAAGNFVVVWLSSAPQGRTRILARRFNADAVAQGPDITVGSSLGLLDVADPSVAMAANGHFVVTWSRGATTDGGLPLYGCIANLPVSLTESDLRYRVYDVSGQPSTVERLAVQRVGVSAGITLLCRFQLAATLSNPGSGTSLKQSAVAMDPDGGFNIAWVTRNASELQFNSSQWSANPSTVQLQHYDGRGNVQGKVQTVDASPAKSDQPLVMLNPRLVSSPNGLLLTWNTSQFDASGPAVVLTVKAQAFASAGVPLGTASVIAQGRSFLPRGDDFWPSVATTETGGGAVAWRASTALGGSYSQQCIVRGVDASGAPHSGSLPFAASSDIDSDGLLLPPFIMDAGDGELLALWGLSGSSGGRIEARFLSPP